MSKVTSKRDVPCRKKLNMEENMKTEPAKRGLKRKVVTTAVEITSLVDAKQQRKQTKQKSAIESGKKLAKGNQSKPAKQIKAQVRVEKPPDSEVRKALNRSKGPAVNSNDNVRMQKGSAVDKNRQKLNNAKHQSVEGTGNLNRGVEEMPQPSPMIPFGYENPTRIEISDFIPPVDNTGGGTEENEENDDDLNELYDGIEVNVNASEDDFVDSDVDDDYDQLVDHSDGGQ